MKRWLSLVLVDDPSLQRQLANTCQAAGMEPLVVAGAREAAVAFDSGEVALLATEGPLGVTDGVGLTRWLRRAGVQTPVFFHTASATEARALEGETALRPFYAAEALTDVIGAEVLAKVAPHQPFDWSPTGLLEAGDFTRLFSAILHGSWSGKVELEFEGNDKVLYFEEGYPVYCFSKIFSENFGQMLLRRGVITEVEYEWARKIQQREGIRQGEALVKIGTLTNQGLFEQLRVQIEEKFINAFAWSGAHYKLVEDDGFLHEINKFSYNPIAVASAGTRRFPHAEGQGLTARASQYATLHCEDINAIEATGSFLGAATTLRLTEPTEVASIAADKGWDDEHARAVFGVLEAFGVVELASCRSALAPSVGAEHVVVASTDREPDEQDQEPAANTSGERVNAITIKELAERLSRAYLHVTSSDHFRALGVVEGASRLDIEEARDRLLGEYSTDRFKPILANKRAKRALREIRAKVSVAATTLLDPRARQTYQDSRDDESNDHAISLKAEDEFLAGNAKLQDNPNEAAEHFQRACGYNPSEHVYMLHLGWARHLTGDPALRTSGKTLILKAITANPMLDDGYLFLAHVVLEEGNLGEALAQAKTALVFNPDNEAAQTFVSRVEERIEREGAGQPLPTG